MKLLKPLSGLLFFFFLLISVSSELEAYNKYKKYRRNYHSNDDEAKKQKKKEENQDTYIYRDFEREFLLPEDQGQSSKPREQIDSDAQKNAANTMVNKGIEYFNTDNFDAAEWQFERAIRIAPNFGPSYFWLAKVKLKKNQNNSALSFLDKAADLLRGHEEWISEIDKLREQLYER